MEPSLASAFARKVLLQAGFTFLTNSLRAVDHFEAYDAYIAPRKETQKMKKTVVVLVATLSLIIATVATVASAQEPERHVFMRHPGGGGEHVASALNLSTDQKVQWDAIHQQLEASVKPLFEQHHAAEQQLNAAASASNPDATEVGRAYLAMRAIDKQIKAAHESTKAKVSAILTPDQKTKFDAMHSEMRHGEPGMTMFKMHHGDDAHE
jgi:Spy/CpxP family protein refolding chaperone